MALSLELNVPIATVEKKRPDKWMRKTKRHGNAKFKWHLVDWSKSNKEIAKQIGTSPNYVSQQRRKLAPITSKKKRLSMEDITFREWILFTKAMLKNFLIRR